MINLFIWFIEHSVSENQESSSSSSSSSSTIRKIKSSKNSAANRELQKKPKGLSIDKDQRLYQCRINTNYWKIVCAGRMTWGYPDIWGEGVCNSRSHFRKHQVRGGQDISAKLPRNHSWKQASEAAWWPWSPLGGCRDGYYIVLLQFLSPDTMAPPSPPCTFLVLIFPPAASFNTYMISTVS